MKLNLPLRGIIFLKPLQFIYIFVISAVGLVFQFHEKNRKFPLPFMHTNLFFVCNSMFHANLMQINQGKKNRFN